MGAPRHALPRGKEPVGASGLTPVSCGGVGRPAGLGPGEGRPGCQRRGHGPARPLGPRVRGSGGDPAPSAPLGRGCRGGRRRAGALARHRGRRRPRPRAGGDAVPGLPRGDGAALPVGLGEGPRRVGPTWRIRLPARPAGLPVSASRGSPHGAGGAGPELGGCFCFGRGVGCIQLSLCLGQNSRSFYKWDLLRLCLYIVLGL